MMKKYIILRILSLLVSCKNREIQQNQKLKMPELSIVKKHLTIVSLENVSKKEMIDWKEYNSLNDFLKRFSSISPNEAINNAVELTKLVKVLKDSIRPKVLKTPSFKTRIYVLENEALRLKDMTLINVKAKLTADEINKQVSKILNAYSATNSKINTVYSQLEVEKQLKLQE